MQCFVRIIEFLKHHLTKGDEIAASWVKKNLTVTQALGVLQVSGRKVSGDVPPMAQAGKALAYVKKGKFPKPVNFTVDDKKSFEDIDGGSKQKVDNSRYDEIRRQISDYEQKIRELRKLLPDD